MNRIGHSRDLHRLKAGKSLKLGGLQIPSEVSAVAHSDGDCLLHSIAEAMLGALALGDLGTHFPDTDSAYEGFDSMQMLKKVYEMVKKRNFELVNVDATIHLEAPKLASHIDKMRQNIATNLGVKTERISVKATRGEGVDAVGRGEAVVCECVLLLHERHRVEYL